MNRPAGLQPEAGVRQTRWPISRGGRAVLCHPDQETAWAPVAVIYFEERRSGLHHLGDLLAGEFDKRIRDAAIIEPLIAARRFGRFSWAPGDPPALQVASDPANPLPSRILGHFDLYSEPPVRLYIDPGHSWLTIVLHHAAFTDKHHFLTLLELLLAAQPAVPSGKQATLGAGGAHLLGGGREQLSLRHERERLPLRGRASDLAGVVARLLSPADPVATSRSRPTSDTFAARALPPIGKGVSTILPQACIDAITAHNAEAGQPLRRIGVTLTRAGDPHHRDPHHRGPNHRGPNHRGMVSYRRIDLPAEKPFAAAFQRAERHERYPFEILHPTPLLSLAAPLVNRLSDTFLLSNFGWLSPAGVRAIEPYSVARGRSAVSISAMRISGGESRLTLRARDLCQEDAEKILDGILANLAEASGPKAGN